MMARWFADKIGAVLRDDGTIHVRGQEIGTWKDAGYGDHVEISGDPNVISALHDYAHGEDVDLSDLGIDLTEGL